MSCISNERGPLFEPDYIISWDFSQSDLPVVSVCRLERDKESPTTIKIQVLGRFYENAGVASLRQLTEARRAEDREEKRGEWLPTEDDNKKRCSKCDVIHLIAQYPNGDINYCPNCGAKMMEADEC